MSEPTDGARVRCLYCGANNFPASPSCWQCGRALQSLPASAPSAMPASSPAPPFSGAGGASAGAGASGAGRAASSGANALAVNPALANKSAAALGLMFPYIALPVGMVFLMLDDPRKTQIGWITIGWSVVGSVLNAILFFLTLAPTLAMLKALMPATGHGGGLPGLPSLPGGDAENIILFLYSSIF